MKTFLGLLLILPTVSFAEGKCQAWRQVVPGCGDTVHCQVGYDIIQPGSSGNCAWASGCQETRQYGHSVSGNIVGWVCDGKPPAGANPNDYLTEVSFTCCKLHDDEGSDEPAVPSHPDSAPPAQ